MRILFFLSFLFFYFYFFKSISIRTRAETIQFYERFYTGGVRRRTRGYYLINTCTATKGLSSQYSSVQSSQLAEQLWTDTGIQSTIRVRQLISTSKKKKCRRGMNGRTVSPNPRKRGKSHHHHSSMPQWCQPPVNDTK